MARSSTQRCVNQSAQRLIQPAGSLKPRTLCPSDMQRQVFISSLYHVLSAKDLQGDVSLCRLSAKPKITLHAGVYDMHHSYPEDLSLFFTPPFLLIPMISVSGSDPVPLKVDKDPVLLASLHRHLPSLLDWTLSIMVVLCTGALSETLPQFTFLGSNVFQC